MSTIPRRIRLNLAARRWMECMERHYEAMDADAGFDAGEFSGPAHGRAMMRDLNNIAVRYRCTAEAVDYRRSALEYIAQHEDPLGAWHGRNE